MAGPKNNLEDVLRRRQENGSSSATPASPAPGQAKVSKFKPASTTSIPPRIATTSRDTFSTPGFGKSKPASSVCAPTFRPVPKIVKPDSVQQPSRASTPVSAGFSRPSIPSKRPSPSLAVETGSPKRLKRDRSPQKENFHDTSKGKGKARAASRSPFSTPTKNKNRVVNGTKPKTPSRRVDADRSLPLDYSDLLQVSASDLVEEYASNLDLKNDLIDLRDRYSNEGRSKYTLNTLRRLQQVVQDRLDCVKAVQTAKRTGQTPVLPPPAWPSIPSAIKPPPPLSALAVTHTTSNSTTRSDTSISSTGTTDGTSERVVNVEDDGEDDENQFWGDVDESLYDSLPEVSQATNDPFVSNGHSSSTTFAVPTVPSVTAAPTPLVTPTSTYASTSTLVSTSTISSKPVSASATSISVSTSLQSTKCNKSNTTWVDPRQSPYYPEMLKVLKSRFRLESFRPKQELAIAHALSGRDVLVLVPTGGGKSLCFQLPALCRSGTSHGVTVVLGPLVALIDDQVSTLQAKNIDVLYFRNAEDEWSINQELRKRRDDPCLLYITPEKLQANNTLRKTLDTLYSTRQIARFVVDEAHVIATWGRDFRPDYNKLSCIRDWWPNVPIMALTASATPNVATDIVNVLQMKDPVRVTDSFNRPNLFYEVRQKPKNIAGEIANWINANHRGKTGIIYCSSRALTELVAKQLRFDYNIDAKHFHAKMDERNKTETQQAWQEGKVKVVVATIAFGMGIDKPDVRFVIHSDVPGSLDAYYQETGRAGRDGKPSHCLFFLAYDKKAFCIKRIWEGEGTDEYKAHAEEEYRRVYDYASNDVECRRVQIMRYFGQSFEAKDCENQCDFCLNSADHEVYEEDMSLEAKQVLVLAGNLCNKINLSKSTLIKTYRGSKAKDIIMYQDQKHYGDGQKLPLNQVDRLIEHLVSERYLDQVPWTTRDQQYTHTKLMTNAKATDFIKNKGKLMLLLKRTVKRNKPESSKRRPPAASASTSNTPRTATTSSDPWAIASSQQQQKQSSSVSDDEYDIEDDPIVVDDDDDDVRTVMKTQLAPASTSGRGNRRAGRSRLLDDPIEVEEEEEERQDLAQFADLGQDKIQELCLKELTELRASLSKSTGTDLTKVIDDEALHGLSVMMPNDASSFVQTLKTMGADWKGLDKASAQKFQHICITYRMQYDEMPKSSRKPSSAASAAELHSRFEFKGS